jgi:hypothetical protein
MGNIWNTILKKREASYHPGHSSENDDHASLELSEFAKRNMGIEIYSEILGCNVWLCSNEEMASQLRQDDPEAITYTVKELIELIKLQPDSDEIIRINHAKKVFANSRIMYSKLGTGIKKSIEDPQTCV